MNLTNSGILDKLVREMLKTYPFTGINVEINALNGYAFQLTNSLNELVVNDSDFSNIDLGECERLLKEENGIDPNISLIFFKFENIRNTNMERDIQYNVYHPITYEKLNLSICENTKIKMTVHLNLSDEVTELIKNILSQGYDPLDLNDKFYREICTPYNSENGTDVLLDDREEYIYSTIKEEMSCPSGCEMANYSLDSKYMTCECPPNNTGIVSLDMQHISTKNIYESVLSSLKNSNYKVMRCYNLVFNFKIFCRNYGSIITLIFFIIYVIFMIYYAFKEITPLKVEISKFLFDEQQKENNKNNDYIKPYVFQTKSAKEEKMTKKSAKSSKSKKGKKKQNKNTKSYPPKRKVRDDFDMKKIQRKKGKGNLQLIDIVKKRHSIKNRNQDADKNSVHSDKVRNRKSILDYQAELVLKTRDNLLKQDQIDQMKHNSSYKTEMTDLKLNDQKVKEMNIYDNYELNNMGYDDACDLDKRTCLKTYLSILLREHYVLFTFVSRNDYNLFYIKIERFFILICTEMTMNGMFFVHETMYKKRTGDTSFAQKIPQIIFSLIVSHVLEVILCFLSMTDVHYYEIKALPKIEKKDEKIFDILSCIKRKLTGFFVFTFIVFLFHWYFISAFCAVYQNTQKIFLRDSAISIATSLIDPFIIYGITCLIRVISLSICCKKKFSCVYKLSDLLPIF